MSYRPFADRYWRTLTGGSAAWGGPSVGQQSTVCTFWQRYWASLTMTGLPSRGQVLVGASGTLASNSARERDLAPAHGQAPAGGLDLIDTRAPQLKTSPVSHERFRVLAPIAAAFAILAVAIGLRLAAWPVHTDSPARTETTGLFPISQTAASHAGISEIAFRPDGTTLAAGDSQGVVRLWDLTTRKLVLSNVVSSPGGAVNSVAFSPDGRLLAVGDSQGVVRLWDLTTRKLVLSKVMPGPGAVNSVAFSPDGRLLAVGDSDGTVSLWNIADPSRPGRLGPPLSSGAGGTVNAVAFSPDGRVLAVGDSDGTVILWDIADPLRPGRPGPPLSSGAGSTVNSVAFSPDGRVLAAGNTLGTVSLWDAATGRPVASLSAGASVQGLAFSPTGGMLAAGDAEGSIYLLNDNGNLLATHHGGGRSVNSVAFSPVPQRSRQATPQGRSSCSL